MNSLNFPTIPSANLTRVNELVTTGHLVKIPGYTRLYTSPHAPGLLLFPIKRWSALSQGQGILAFGGPTAAGVSAMSMVVNAANPLETVNAVVDGAGAMLKNVPKLSSAEVVYPVCNTTVDISIDPGNNGVRKTTSSNMDVVINYEFVASTTNLFCALGVITGATIGSYHSMASKVGAWAPIASLQSYPNGFIATGLRKTLRSLAIDRRSDVLVDIPSSLKSKADSAFDEWISTHWAMEKTLILGTEIELQGVALGFTTGTVGGVSHGQSYVGINMKDTYQTVATAIDRGAVRVTSTGTFTEFYNTSPWGHLSTTKVGTDRGDLVYISAPFSYTGDSIKTNSPPAGFDEQVWLKAMFLARPDLNSPYFPASSSGVSEGSYDLSEVNTTDNSQAVMSASFDDAAEMNFAQSEALRVSLLGTSVVQPSACHSVVLASMHGLDKLIKARI